VPYGQTSIPYQQEAGDHRQPELDFIASRAQNKDSLQERIGQSNVLTDSGREENQLATTNKRGMGELHHFKSLIADPGPNDGSESSTSGQNGAAFQHITVTSGQSRRIGATISGHRISLRNSIGLVNEAVPRSHSIRRVGRTISRRGKCAASSKALTLYSQTGSNISPIDEFLRTYYTDSVSVQPNDVDGTPAPHAGSKLCPIATVPPRPWKGLVSVGEVGRYRQRVRFRDGYTRHTRSYRVIAYGELFPLCLNLGRQP
jgi:hypothetical protein